MRRLLLSLALMFAAPAFAQEFQGLPGELEIPGVQPPLQYPVTFEESDFETKPWLKEFEWIVVVNKANKGADKQSLRVYRHQRLLKAEDFVSGLRAQQLLVPGRGFEDDLGDEFEDLEIPGFWERFRRPRPKPQRPPPRWEPAFPDDDVQINDFDVEWHIADLKKRAWAPGVFKISTGREEFEAKGQNNANKDNYTITPSGYFVPQYFTPEHKSEAYSNKNCSNNGEWGYVEVTEETMWGPRITQRWQELPKCVVMNDVIFFNGGIALHRAIPGTEPALGSRASGGCVRLPGAIASYLYTELKAARATTPIPLVKQDGTAAQDAAGNIQRVLKNKSIWGSLDARRALIIVLEKYVEPPPPPPKPVPLPKPRPKPAPKPR